jgi:hypothetical protein
VVKALGQGPPIASRRWHGTFTLFGHTDWGLGARRRHGLWRSPPSAPNAFGLATEVGTREQMLHSYELIARYVMPKFQGTLDSLVQSQNYFAGLKDYQELQKTF